MNVVVLTGRLTRDPEVKFGQSGKAYCKFSLAVDKAFSKGDKKEADFINCAAFGKTAELIGEYLRKGNKTGITGSLAMNQYEVNGEKRVTYEVMVNSVEFLESKNSSSEYTKPEQPKRETPQENNRNSQQSSSYDDDDFPF